MKRIGKNFLGTVGLIAVLAVIMLLAKGISMIPLGVILSFLLSDWKGIVLGVAVSYLGMAVTEIFFKTEKEEEEEKKKKK